MQKRGQEGGTNSLLVHAELVLEGRGALDRGGGEAREVWDRRGAAECDGLGCHLEKKKKQKTKKLQGVARWQTLNRAGLGERSQNRKGVRMNRENNKGEEKEKGGRWTALAHWVSCVSRDKGEERGKSERMKTQTITQFSPKTKKKGKKKKRKQKGKEKCRNSVLEKTHNQMSNHKHKHKHSSMRHEAHGIFRSTS